MLRSRGRKGSPKRPRTFRLAADKIAAAQRILRTRTATETIETALDMIVFRQELIQGTQAMVGVRMTPAD